MPRRTVFICYSRKDDGFVQAFRTHLAPYVQRGLLEVWLDLEIRASEDWERKIRESIDRADAAVLMVSPDMLASEYVTREELPRLVEHAESGRLRLTSLYLRDAHPERVEVAGLPLTRYQGLNQPTEPVASLPDSQHDKALARAVERLWQMIEETPPRAERHRSPAGRTLTVELRLRPSRLDRRFSRPDSEHFHNNSSPFDLRRLTAMADGEAGEPLADFLGETLLGGDAEAITVVRKGFGDDNPVRRGGC